MAGSRRTRPVRFILLVLVFSVFAVFGMGLKCDSSKSPTSPSEVSASACRNPTELGSSIVDRSACATAAKNAGCSGWAFVNQECSCCH